MLLTIHVYFDSVRIAKIFVFLVLVRIWLAVGMWLLIIHRTIGRLSVSFCLIAAAFGGNMGSGRPAARRKHTQVSLLILLAEFAATSDGRLPVGGQVLLVLWLWRVSVVNLESSWSH